MAKTPPKRRRRTPQEARAHVIACAESLLLEGGPLAVEMRAVARKAQMTDTGIAHHFGNHEGLLNALMDHGAQKVRFALDALIADWLNEAPDLEMFIRKLSDLYTSGYAALAVQLHQTGWQDKGSVLLEPVVEALVRLNKNPDTSPKDLRTALASLHLWLALDPLYGEAFRRSAGLKGKATQKAQTEWWLKTLHEMLNLPAQATAKKPFKQAKPSKP